MGKRKVLFLTFFILALVQLYVPAKMILDKEDVLTTGTEYKFKTAPIDPNDPFRGKYITLRFEENSVHIENADEWGQEEFIYVFIGSDSLGFAKIDSVTKIIPDNGKSFIKVKPGYISGDKNGGEMRIEYPFDRFYLEESKAEEAELAYQESQTDTVKVTYAVVSIKEGEAVLKDVKIDGVSIKEIVESRK